MYRRIFTAPHLPFGNACVIDADESVLIVVQEIIFLPKGSAYFLEVSYKALCTHQLLNDFHRIIFCLLYLDVQNAFLFSTNQNVVSTFAFVVLAT